MSVRQALLQQLTNSRNVAVERAVEAALADATPREQNELAEVLLQRNRRSGWVALIRVFDKLDPEIQAKLISRPRDLFGPLSETMQDSKGSSRENVIAIVGRCSEPKLVYLLAEALMDSRLEVRELAGRSLLATVRQYCSAPPAAATMPNDAPVGAGEDHPLDDEGAAQLRRAVDFALRQYKSHRQTGALLAALIFERQQDAPMWALFHDTYDEMTRAATVILRAPSEPGLARAVLLSLGSALRPAAMAGLASMENPVMAAAVARESYRLVDPVLRDGARTINHLKLLTAQRKEPPWKLENWSSWLRLIENVGMQLTERLTWLQRMLESAPAGASAGGGGWKISVLRAIADTALPEAGAILEQYVVDPDERVARSAARHLLSRRQPEWRDRIDALRRSPYASVRQLSSLAAARGPRDGLAAITSSAKRTAEGFEKAWNDFQKMPPAVQHSTARSAMSDPAYLEQLRGKLNGTSPTDIAQGLRMLGSAPSLTPFRAQIIALCGHADTRLSAMAVRLLGRLEDPRLKDLLEAAAHHSDARVRANAIESMAELQIANRSQQVLSMLNSRHNRERANAIRAISQFDFATARECLSRMLGDSNPTHRMSALWVVAQLDLLEIMRQVSLVARRDPNLRVRKRAAEMLESIGGHVPFNA